MQDIHLQQGTAATYPEPEDKEAFIRAQVYSTTYEDFSPKVCEGLLTVNKACQTQIYDWTNYDPQHLNGNSNEGDTPGVIN